MTTEIPITRTWAADSKNLYHKHITKDGNYKKYLKFSRHLDDIQQKLASLNGKKADYALCIRANIYPQRNPSPPSANTAMFV